MSIDVRNVSKNFGDFVALDDVSVSIPTGGLTALLGPSGGGKSTLLRVIAGLEHADSGDVTIEGTLATHLPARKRNVGFVFQHYAAFKHLSVFRNVAFGLEIRKRPKDDIRERVHELLRLVHLEQFAERLPSQLSGGQRQRMALARALAVEPNVLLLDEPFGALDAKVRKELREWLRRLHDEVHVTTIFVTHDQEEAFTIADQVGVLDRGRLEQLGPPETIYHHPASPFVAEFVGAADFLPGIVTSEGIVTEIGVFGNVEAREPGEKVRVMIRPDDVTFVPDPQGEAVILRRSFRGSENLYSLGLPSGHRVHSSQPSSAAFATGTRVRPEAHVLHVVTFPAE